MFWIHATMLTIILTLSTAERKERCIRNHTMVKKETLRQNEISDKNRTSACLYDVSVSRCLQYPLILKLTHPLLHTYADTFLLVSFGGLSLSPSTKKKMCDWFYPIQTRLNVKFLYSVRSVGVCIKGEKKKKQQNEEWKQSLFSHRCRLFFFLFFISSSSFALVCFAFLSFHSVPLHSNFMSHILNISCTNHFMRSFSFAASYLLKKKKKIDNHRHT